MFKEEQKTIERRVADIQLVMGDAMEAMSGRDKAPDIPEARRILGDAAAMLGRLLIGL